MEQVIGYKTFDGRVFESLDEANIHEEKLNSEKLKKRKEKYIREELKKSIYGYIFTDPHGSRRFTNILPCVPLVEVLLTDTKLVREIINELENMK